MARQVSVKKNIQDDSLTKNVRVEELKLNMFRNYTNLSIKTKKQHVILTGPNGAGKTNLLEAISYLSPGKGLRRVQHNQPANMNGNGSWAVHCSISGVDGNTTIGTGYEPQTNTLRRLKINEQEVSKESLLDYVRVIWLTPAMDGLFTGPPNDRRKFLDRLVLAIDPEHGTRVRNFEKAMRGRNKLLEDASSDPKWIDGLESQMAETGTAIACAREEFVSLVGGIIIQEDGDAFPSAEMEVEGWPEKNNKMNPAEIEDSYKRNLASMRNRDQAAGRAVEGPHRANLAVRHRERKVNADICSTGEQKALLTGIVIAHAKLIRDVSAMTPIILLDEIAAHLDQNRRDALFDIINQMGCQTWMTGTDKKFFDGLKNEAEYITVRNGGIAESQND